MFHLLYIVSRKRNQNVLNVSTLPRETWNANCAHVTVELWQKETLEFIPPQLYPPNSPIWMQHVRNIARDGVQNTHHWSGAVSDVTDKWLPQWWHDPACPTPFLVGVLVRSDQWCVFCTPSLAIVPHDVINWIQIWQIWGHSWGGINSGVSSCINSIIAHVRWAFQV